jgi:hypothetical protein
LVAIYAIALHAILWGVAPMAAGPSADPFSVICHSEPAAPDQQSPASQVPAPAHVCDHCTLCGAAAAAAALDSVVTGQLAPARLLHVMPPASAGVRGHLATTPNLARGPPPFA